VGLRARRVGRRGALSVLLVAARSLSRPLCPSREGSVGWTLPVSEVVESIALQPLACAPFWPRQVALCFVEVAVPVFEFPLPRPWDVPRPREEAGGTAGQTRWEKRRPERFARRCAILRSASVPSS